MGQQWDDTGAIPIKTLLSHTKYDTIELSGPHQADGSTDCKLRCVLCNVFWFDKQQIRSSGPHQRGGSTNSKLLWVM